MGKGDLGAGSTKIWKREQGAAKKWEMGQGAREVIGGARGKIEKEQGAKRDEKGAVKIVKRSEHRKMQANRENGVKCRREQGA